MSQPIDKEKRLKEIHEILEKHNINGKLDRSRQLKVELHNLFAKWEEEWSQSDGSYYDEEGGEMK